MALRLPRLLAVAALAALAACADPPENTRLHVYDEARERHPIQLKTRIETAPVVAAQTAGITEAEQARLDRFIADYLAAGGGPLSITASDSVGGPEVAARRAERVAAYAQRRGVLPQELAVRVGATPNNQPVVLSFQHYSLRPKDCGRTAYEETTRDARNFPHSRFGCATQNNLAAMIANPADLAMPRTETPFDRRRSLAIEAYRAGTPPDSQRSPFAGVGSF